MLLKHLLRRGTCNTEHLQEQAVKWVGELAGLPLAESFFKLRVTWEKEAGRDAKVRLTIEGSDVLSYALVEALWVWAIMGDTGQLVASPPPDDCEQILALEAFTNFPSQGLERLFSAVHERFRSSIEP